MTIKTISFRPQDSALEAWAEQQAISTGAGLSQYVRQLIERDMAMEYMRDVAPGMVRLVEALYNTKKC